VNNNNENTDKENILKNQQNAQSNSDHTVPRALLSHDSLPPGLLPPKNPPGRCLLVASLSDQPLTTSVEYF